MSRPAARIARALTGLRPRLLAAMLITSAVTLGVAALALLSPLEARLRADGMRTVRSAISATRPAFSEAEVEPATGEPKREDLREAAIRLARRSAGAQVTVLDRNLEVLYAPPNHNLDVPDYYAAARRALASGSQTHATTADSLIVVQRIHIGVPPNAPPYALIVIKHLEYVSLAVHVVQNAFIVAAAAGLGIALLLGIGIATTLLRRLERLRDATRELERRGLDAPLPHDSGHDEISELSRAFAALQSRMRRQEDARRTFVATASHELRTPLASLDGMLELLEDDLDAQRPDLQDARLRTEHAREQTRRLSQLASDLLDLSRLDTEVQLRTEPLELSEMCRAVAAEFELTAAKRDVTLSVRTPTTSCWAQADPGAVARIVRILVDNALRFAPDGSTIEIAPSPTASLAARDESRLMAASVPGSALPSSIAAGAIGLVQVSVSDDGPGVPEDDRERIFERFTRGSNTAGRSGFGLGLAIGRELAQRMDGDLTLLDGPHAARNGRPAGASFALRLPAAMMEMPPSPVDAATGATDSLRIRSDAQEIR